MKMGKGTIFIQKCKSPAKIAGLCKFATLLQLLTLRGGNVIRAVRVRLWDEVVVRISYTDRLSQGPLCELLAHPKTSLLRQL
jgi:hypothetical protein